MKLLALYRTVFLSILLSSLPSFSCSLALAFWNSQLLSPNGKVMRAATFRDNHFLENPFIYNPKFTLIRNSTGLRAQILEEKTGIILRLEGKAVVAEFHRGNQIDSHSFEVNFPFRELFRGRPFPSYLPWSGESYEVLTQFMIDKAIPSLLGKPEQELKKEFLRIVNTDQNGYKGMALFPRHVYHIPESPNLEDEILGIQIEGRVDTKLMKKQYAVIQAVIRMGQLQIWWITDEGSPKYQKFPLSIAYDSKGYLRYDLVGEIYESALRLANEDGTGFVYKASEKEPKVTIQSESLSWSLGWEMFDSKPPKLLTYMNRKVYVRTGKYQGQVGTVTFESEHRERRILAATNAVDKELMVLMKDGETERLNTLNVVIIDEGKLRNRKDPLTGATLRFTAGMKVVSITNQLGFQVGEQFEITRIDQPEAVILGNQRGTIFYMRLLNQEGQPVGKILLGDSDKMIPAVYY